MELDQLFQNAPYLRETTGHMQPFDFDTLGQAFQLRETAPVDLPSAEKGIPTICGKSKEESKDKDRTHKNHKDKDKEKDKEHKKHKHRHKDWSKDKDKEKKDKVGIMTLVVITQRNNMTRRGSMMVMKISRTRRSKRKVSIRVRRSMNWEDKDSEMINFLLF